MSNLKEKVAVPDLWSDKRFERRIETLESRHSKQVQALKERIEELEYALDGIERAFWMGVIGLTIFNLVVVTIAIF